MAKDMYADLERIEARGKRKKEKSKGLFSSFGKKDEPEPESENQPEPRSEPKPEPVKPAPEAKPKAEPSMPKPTQQPAQSPAPKPVPVQQAQPAQNLTPKPTPQPSTTPTGWQPPTGSKLRDAENELLEYKRWLNKGYKSGMLAKDQCVVMVKKKEIELGLRPPE